ncbi:VOC family protein [Nocardioides sp.]|uniref:VOC family protein n=1 Tax=Nocardioides sp. TaxID=35761 RepID=UPI0035B21A6C
MSNHTIVIPTPDLAAATAFYTVAWGTEPHTDTPYYVGFNLDGQEIGLNPNGERDRMAGPVVYWQTDDLAAKVAEVEAAGGTVVRPVREVGGGTSLALMTDPAGNQVGFITQAG